MLIYPIVREVSRRKPLNIIPKPPMQCCYESNAGIKEFEIWLSIPQRISNALRSKQERVDIISDGLLILSSMKFKND